MSMEFSAEDFINGGMGVKATPKYTVASTEGFDGWTDNLSMEMYKAEQELQSLEHFEAISTLNATQKLNMVKRIAKNYVGTIGNSMASNSIESVCMAQIKSLEDAAAAPKEGATPVDAPAGEGGKKKMSFMKTIFGAIAKFFRTIWDFIVKAVTTFVGKIKSLFAKKGDNNNAATTDAKSDLTNNASATGSTTASAAGDSKIEKHIDKAKIMLDFSKKINPSGLNTFVARYTLLGTSIDNLWKQYSGMISKLKNNKDTGAPNESDVNRTANRVFNAGNKQHKEAVTKIDDVIVLFPNIKRDKNAGSSVADLKKYLNNVTQSVATASGKNDDLYVMIKSLFGLERGMDKNGNLTIKMDAASKGAAKGQAQQTIDSLAGIEKNFVEKVKKPHDSLVRVTDEIQKLLDPRLADDKKTINETTETMGIMQGMLKVCCKLEQVCGKLITKTNSAALQFVSMV